MELKTETIPTIIGTLSINENRLDANVTTTGLANLHNILQMAFIILYPSPLFLFLTRLSYIFYNFRY